ncbi:hypothetical protein [Thalassococcus sp. S3]|uniref:hypothetical protein n=1 Tax=Thalassococcus sp. S3 TaxID=2017482 RepID=UPI001023FC5E|nr:hypothetical protein [Thalassococcus sp. S3]QBF30980.1 hypothetical protein CFI11_07075 [Thalassococcus sp. S3]
MIRTPVVALALLLAITAPVLAQSSSEAEETEPTLSPAETLNVYAGFGKLEAHMAKAAGALMVAATPDLPELIASDAREEFSSEAAQVERHVLELNEMTLTKSQDMALVAFSEAWALALTEADTILTEGDASVERIWAWWESLNALDELIDGQLSAMLGDDGTVF